MNGPIVTDEEQVVRKVTGMLGSVYSHDDRQWLLRQYLACPDSVRETIGEKAFKDMGITDDEYFVLVEAMVAEHLGYSTGQEGKPLIGGDR